MRFCIEDMNTGKAIEITDLVIDTLEQGEKPEWTDVMVCEAVEIAAEIAREMFGHDNVNAGTI
jgi:hypothetical protein